MTTRGASTQDDLRRHNLARLFRRLHEGGAARRSDLVAFTGLNRSTVGVLVSELADAGLVDRILAEGAGKAREVSDRVMKRVRTAVGIGEI
jgi:DNA-binding transcriptional ArsR family regulator